MWLQTRAAFGLPHSQGIAADWSGEITQTSVASILGYACRPWLDEWVFLYKMRLFSSADFPTISRLGSLSSTEHCHIMSECDDAARSGYCCLSFFHFFFFGWVNNVGFYASEWHEAQISMHWDECGLLFISLPTLNSGFYKLYAFFQSIWQPSIPFCPSIIAFWIQRLVLPWAPAHRRRPRPPLFPSTSSELCSPAHHLNQ